MISLQCCKCITPRIKIPTKELSELLQVNRRPQLNYTHLLRYSFIPLIALKRSQ